MGLNFLHFLEQFRTPWLTSFFSAVTALGEEAIFIAIFLILLWCCERKYANRLFCVFFSGLFVNQVLKLIFHVPRPWELDPTLNTVESAKAGAGGYSFPSGHTQSAMGLYGSFFVAIRRHWVRILCVLLIVLVGFSRLYLGVHTPWDVLVSLAVGALLLVAFRFLFPVLDKTKWGDLWALGGMCILGVIATSLSLFPSLRAETLHNGCRLFGCALAMLLAELCYRRQEPPLSAGFMGNLIKVAVGLPLFTLLRSLLKAPLQQLLGVEVGDSVRYFLLLFLAAAVYPLWFRFLPKKKH